jgi:hypothetical protein
MALAPYTSGYNSVVQRKNFLPSRDKVWFYGIECKYEVIMDNVKGVGWKIIMDEKINEMES